MPENYLDMLYGRERKYPYDLRSYEGYTIPRELIPSVDEAATPPTTPTNVLATLPQNELRIPKIYDENEVAEPMIGKMPVNTFAQLAGIAAHALDPQGFGGRLGAGVANFASFQEQQKGLNQLRKLQMLKAVKDLQPNALDVYKTKREQIGLRREILASANDPTSYANSLEEMKSIGIPTDDMPKPESFISTDKTGKKMFNEDLFNRYKENSIATAEQISIRGKADFDKVNVYLPDGNSLVFYHDKKKGTFDPVKATGIKGATIIKPSERGRGTPGQQTYEYLTRSKKEGGLGLTPSEANKEIERQKLLGKYPPGVPLVSTIGPEGVPIYTPRSEAVGKEVPASVGKKPKPTVAQLAEWEANIQNPKDDTVDLSAYVEAFNTYADTPYIYTMKREYTTGNLLKNRYLGWETKKYEKVPLPKVRTKQGQLYQLKLSDIRESMRASGKSFDEVLADAMKMGVR